MRVRRDPTTGDVQGWGVDFPAPYAEEPNFTPPTGDVFLVRTPREILDALKASGKWDTIWNAAQQSPDLTYWLYQTLGGNVQSDDPKTIAGCQWAVQSGLLTAEECLAVFGVTV